MWDGGDDHEDEGDQQAEEIVDQQQELRDLTELHGKKELSGRRGGGKLNRSETVTVRLDPKLNYLCELAARAQRRTKSSFIEWAIEHALDDVPIPGERKNAAGHFPTIADRSADLWDVEEPDRLMALAYLAPSLLTHEEQVMWKLITTSGWFWRGHWGGDNDDKWLWDTESRWNLIPERVRTEWDKIKGVAEGDKPRSEFWMFGPLVQDKPVGFSRPAPSFDDDLDSDVPF